MGRRMRRLRRNAETSKTCGYRTNNQVHAKSWDNGNRGTVKRKLDQEPPPPPNNHLHPNWSTQPVSTNRSSTRIVWDDGLSIHCFQTVRARRKAGGSESRHRATRAEYQAGR